MWISLMSWRTTTLGLGATRLGLWHHFTPDRPISDSTKRYLRLIILIQFLSFFFFFTSNGCIVKICFYVYMIQRKILIFFFKICIIIIKHPRGLHDTKSRRRIYTIVSRIYFSFLSFKTKI